MKILRTILAILAARWFWTLVGAVLLSLAIYLFGDVLRMGDSYVLGSETRRMACVLVIAVLWGVGNLWRQERARRSNAQLVAALAPVAREPAPTPGAEEVQELGRRFQAALAQLRREKLGAFGRRRWLYELPWYVMIGPPGTGKTTALVHSGLRFPVSAAEDLPGTGGTRSCDWLFTDEAVLIDTAGRYVTQDSDAAADRAEWQGFLDLLRRHRPRQPLNGVLVALSVRELLEDRAGNTDHAARIRARLQELEQRLEVRLPVYLVVTKADLLAGFSEFFERLEERDREQVWGHTFAGRPGKPETPDAQAVRSAIDDLVARLDRRLPRRLAEEDDPVRRADIFGFPAQLAGLAGHLARFVERCFAPAAYERGGWLRGVYFTSGTQIGSPIDRLLDAITTNLGLPGSPRRTLAGDRPYFLTRLLREVVFGEASLVNRDPVRERREIMVRAAALLGTASLGLVLCAGWAWSFVQNAALQERFAAELEVAAKQLQPLGQTRLAPAQGNYLPALPVLDHLADVRDQMAQSAPWSARLGLSRRGAMEERASAAYQDALAHVLLPRLVLSLEASLRQRLGDADYVLEGLKVYLMLGNQAPYVPDTVTAWLPSIR
jgi:type VI secretion system protein ImpL